MPLVTVGVASYNNAKFIADTLDSIAQQSYPNIEFLIVDDCSPDNSVEVINQWIVSHPEAKARLIRHEVNKGVSAVYGRLLSEANGKYISIVGSDDIYLKDKILKQVTEFEKLPEDYAVIYSDMYVIDEKGNMQEHTQIRSNEPSFVPVEGFIFDRILVQNTINAPSIMLRTNLIREVGGYDESLAFEDYDMWLRLARKYRFKFSDFISVKYRVLSTSLWNSRSAKFYETLIKTLIKHQGVSDSADAVIKNHVINIAQLMYKNGYKEANKWLKYAYSLNKSLKSLILLSMNTVGLNYKVYDMLFGNSKK